MGQKELIRGNLAAQVEKKQITVRQASSQLGVSYRQGKRILAAYRSGGDAALIHGNSGKSLGMFFDEETTEGAMRTFWHWIELYGIPKAHLLR